MPCYVDGQMNGEIKSSQMIGEEQPGRAQIHDCYACDWSDERWKTVKSSPNA